MSDPSSAAGQPRTREEISQEIGRSLSPIWLRRDGARPASVDTEYVGDVVRCVVVQGDASAEDGEEPAPARTGSGPDHEAQAAVARLTKRSVVAYIGKRDAKTGRATHAFILEPARVKN